MAAETPKGVSSRLLTMKFMQRAAASAASSPGTDTESPSSKKRKLTHRDHAQTKLDIEIEQASIRAAIDDRDAKRQAALEKHAFGADTHWVLDSHWDQNKIEPSKKQPLRIIHVGYGDGDISEEDIEDDPQAGRTSTKRHRASQETVRRIHKATFKTMPKTNVVVGYAKV
jgi:hypothetical protein